MRWKQVIARAKAAMQIAVRDDALTKLCPYSQAPQDHAYTYEVMEIRVTDKLS